MALTPGLQLPFGIQPVNAVPVDSFLGPYSGSVGNDNTAGAIASANASISSALRYKSMAVHLIITGSSYKFWYKDGIADGDLVLFSQGGEQNSYFSSTTAGSIFTTGSLAIRGAESIDSPSDKGSDVFFYVSGSSNNKSLFGGDVVVSGSTNALNNLFVSGVLLVNTSSASSAGELVSIHVVKENAAGVGRGVRITHRITGSSVPSNMSYFGFNSSAEAHAGSTGQSYSQINAGSFFAYHHSPASVTLVNGLNLGSFVGKPETGDTAGNVSSMRGFDTAVGYRSNNFTGSISTAVGQRIYAGATSNDRTITNLTGLLIGAPNFGGPGVTNAIGIDIQPMSASATRLSIRARDPIVIGPDNVIGSEMLRVSGSSYFENGPASFMSGLSGSLTRLTDGTPYLIAAGGISTTTASNGSITISTTGASTVAGSDTHIQFNDGGVFGGVSGFTFDKTTNTLNITGGITGSGARFADLTVTGTASVYLLNTVNQQSLVIGDKFITILSGAADHLTLDGSGILWGSGSSGQTYDEHGSHGHVLYRQSNDALEVFPGLVVSGNLSTNGNTNLTGSLIISGSTYATGSLNVSGSISSSLGIQVGSPFITDTSFYNLSNFYGELDSSTGRRQIMRAVQRRTAARSGGDANDRAINGTSIDSSPTTGDPTVPIGVIGNVFYNSTANSHASSFYVGVAGGAYMSASAGEALGTASSLNAFVAEVGATGAASSHIHTGSCYVASSGGATGINASRTMHTIQGFRANNLGVGSAGGIANIIGIDIAQQTNGTATNLGIRSLSPVVINASNVTGSEMLRVSGSSYFDGGPASFVSGLSGSLTRLTDGTPYLIAGNGISTATASNGSITISTTGASTIAGSNTQIQFNDGGVFGADDGFTYNKNSDTLFVSGTVLINKTAQEYGEILSVNQLLTSSTDFVRAGAYIKQTLTGSNLLPGGDQSLLYGLIVESYNKSKLDPSGYGMTAVQSYAYHQSTSSINIMEGYLGGAAVIKPEDGNTAGNVLLMTGLYAGNGFLAATNFTGSITNAYGVRYNNFGVNSARTITNSYGIQLSNVGAAAGVTNAIGIDIEKINTASGIKLGIRAQDPIVVGTTNVGGSEMLHISGSSYFNGLATFTSGSIVTGSLDVSGSISASLGLRAGSPFPVEDNFKAGSIFYSELGSADQQVAGLRSIQRRNATSAAFSSERAIAGVSVDNSPSTPSQLITVVGTNGEVRYTSTSNAHPSSTYAGVSALASLSSSVGAALGTVGQILGFSSFIGYAGNPVSGHIHTGSCYRAANNGGMTASKTMHTIVGFSAANLGANSAGGIANVIGVDIAQQVGGTATNLGIRSLSPVVIGTNVATGTEMLHVSGSSTGTNTSLLVRHGVANGSNLPVINFQNSVGSSLFFVSGSGNIGIGTTAPTSRLQIAGDVTPSADNSFDLGSATNRWRNVYTGDLHLRNDRGDYTLIEEEDMLTIRFNKTGKRYKFLLEAVPHLDEDPHINLKK